MPVITCDGSKEVEVQAEPVEAIIPYSSKYNSIASPSTSIKVILMLLGKRFSPKGGPFKRTLGISACTRSHKYLAISKTRFHSFSRDVCANSNALAKPTMPEIFSVPERIARSCPPPQIIGRIFTPRRMYSAPTPLGP